MIIIIMCSVILILVEGCNATQVGLSQRFIVLKIYVILESMFTVN